MPKRLVGGVSLMAWITFILLATPSGESIGGGLIVDSFSYTLQPTSPETMVSADANTNTASVLVYEVATFSIKITNGGGDQTLYAFQSVGVGSCCVN